MANVDSSSGINNTKIYPQKIFSITPIEIFLVDFPQFLSSSGPYTAVYFPSTPETIPSEKVYADKLTFTIVAHDRFLSFWVFLLFFVFFSDNHFFDSEEYEMDFFMSTGNETIQHKISLIFCSFFLLSYTWKDKFLDHMLTLIQQNCS